MIMAAAATPSGTPLWEVTGTNHGPIQLPDGSHAMGTIVSYRTRSGGSGTVDIPADKMRAGVDAIRPIIDAAARTTEAVHTMTGPPA